MTTRTSSSTVTFVRPFVLSGIDGTQPAGTYIVETDEELILSLSFPAYHRVGTWIRLPLASSSSGFARVASIDPSELEAALVQDTGTK